MAIIGCIVSATTNKTPWTCCWGDDYRIRLWSYFRWLCQRVRNASQQIARRWYRIDRVLYSTPWVLVSTLMATSIYTRTALSWRWFSIIGTIYATVSVTGVTLFYFPPSRPAHDYGKPRWQEFRELDFIVYLLFGGGLRIALVGLSWAGTQYAWDSAAFLAPLIIGICAVAASFIYDFTVPESPLFPLSLLREFRRYTIFVVIAFVAGFIYRSMAAMLPQVTLFVFTSDPIQIGIIQIPNGVGQLIFGAVSSAEIGLIGHLRLQLIFWVTLMTVSIVCLAATIPNHKAAFMAVRTFGMGPFPTVTVVAYVIVSLNVPLRHLRVAIGLIGTFRSAGGSLGNAILQTILNSIVESELAPAIISAGTQHGFPLEHAGELIQATVSNAVGVPYVFRSVPGASYSSCSEGRLRICVSTGFPHHHSLRRNCHRMCIVGK
ncbi:uncharacterized protein Z518_09611 [Rhinocladiella mackenziei CBS 650.93]|uniref:Major facilitator superfamily (MFS) profile domain-containing protein n=1 Tax=Rhinocladiella mackenziei CBS 650.93 TaxID=1442369 RepID=A0A0D2IB89_9EURO|nr:uncharacterized protein Z518_09611 [Rhinocladiella mackenziei CBS 650.93]KIX00546.1 hypothetical protein Z518_09611 [Rhinocladiella mackenziei CBS 650.93]